MKKFALILEIPATPELEAHWEKQIAFNLDIDTTGKDILVELADADLNTLASGVAECQQVLYDDVDAFITRADYDAAVRNELHNHTESLIDSAIRRQRRTGEPTLRNLFLGGLHIATDKKKGGRSKAQAPTKRG